MRYPKLREIREALKALIKGPYTTRFPHQPHKPFERFRSRPYFYQEDCVGCTACAQVCPSQAIDVQDKVIDGVAKRKLTVHWDICIFCGQCEANCLTGKGIILSQEFDLATTAKRQELMQTIEKDLVLCEVCGDIIVPYDQFVWLAERLGPLTFANASLMLFYLRRSGLALKEDSRRQNDGELSRADRLKVLCPRCRREAAIKS